MFSIFYFKFKIPIPHLIFHIKFKVESMQLMSVKW